MNKALTKEWYEIENVDFLLTPALAIYPDRIQANIESMIQIAGDVNRLRPHVKTYKMPEIVKMQMNSGIQKFKCATIAEAEMLMDAQCTDILLAMPTVGPQQSALIELKRKNPSIKFSALIDHPSQISEWKSLLNGNESFDLFIDVNVGMSRTGTSSENVISLYKAINKEHQLNIRGLHVYDGHNRIENAEERKSKVDSEFEAVSKVLEVIDPDEKLEVVCGGSVTFPCHAKDVRRNLSPGTTLLWDAGYGSKFPDIPMKNAAVLVSRIISMPGSDRICLDLGHKSVASEMQGKRVIFPQLENYERVGHSEEHLVLQVLNRDSLHIGQVLYGIPWHICPTVALHEEVAVVKENQMTEFWQVAARKRRYRLSNTQV